MKQRTFSRFLILSAALVATVGVVLTLQRRETTALRRELAQIHASTADLERLRAENQRLCENQISAAELEKLRADHAAIQQLWSELDVLTKKPSVATP
jgi:hypothetical protein